MSIYLDSLWLLKDIKTINLAQDHSTLKSPESPKEFKPLKVSFDIDILKFPPSCFEKSNYSEVTDTYLPQVSGDPSLVG